MIFSIFTIPIPITFSQESDPSSGDQGSSEGTTSGDANDSDASNDGESNEESSSEEDGSNDESGSDPAGDSGDESEESSSDDQPAEPSGSGNQTGGSEDPADSDPSGESDNPGNQTSDESNADQPAEPSEEPSSASNQTGTEPVDSGSSSSNDESDETEVYVELEEDGSGIAQLEDDTTKVDFETGSIYFGDTIEEGGTLNMTALPPEDFVSSLLEEELEAMYIQEEGEEFEVSTETGAGYTMEGYVIDIDFENVTLAEEGITLALEYAAGLSEAEEQGIRILHFNHETLVWEVLLNNDDSINGGQEVDAENNIVYGTTYSFSHFVPGSGSTVDPATIDTPTSPTSDNTPTITGTKDAGTEVSLFDSETDDFLGIDGPNASTTWSITTSSLTDGLHELFAVSTDGVSNSTSTGMEIEIDTGPTTTIATASPSTSSASTTLDATVTDSGIGDSDIVAAEYFIDIDPPGSYGTGISLSATDGTFDEVTEDITGAIDFTGYDDGMHTIYVHAKDDTDNWGLTTPVIFTLDTTAPPAPVITYPSVDDIFASFPDIEGDVATNFLAQWGTFGTGDGEFDEPFDIAVAPSGVNFVVDTGNDRVQYWSDDSFILEWDGSEGEAFVSPVSIAMDEDGFLFVGDNVLQNIQKFDSFGGFYTSWGSSGSDDGEFMNPLGIAATGSDDTAVVYVADTGNHRIQKFDGDGNFITKWGRNGGDGTSGSADGEFDSPYGVAVDADGNVYVADTGNDRIQKFDSDGNFIAKWGSSGFSEGEFNFPRGVAVDIAGDIYVVDELNDRIQKFDSDGNFITEWGKFGTEEGQFDSPNKMGFDELGNSYVVDYNNNRIQKFEADAEDPIIELFDNGDSIGTLDPAPLAGFWFFTPDEEFGDGTYNVTAIVTDAAGNQSPESNSVTFTVASTLIEVDLDSEGFGSAEISNETEQVIFGQEIDEEFVTYGSIHFVENSILEGGTLELTVLTPEEFEEDVEGGEGSLGDYGIEQDEDGNMIIEIDGLQYQVAGYFVDVNTELISFDGDFDYLATLAIEYEDAGLDPSEEGTMRVLHFDGGCECGEEWELLSNVDELVDNGTNVNANTNTGYGSSSFSLFTLGFRTGISHTGGPDDFGYTFEDSTYPGTEFDWIEISDDIGELDAGTEILTDSDGDVAVEEGIDIGFEFEFYGTIYETVNIASNGIVLFETGNYSELLFNDPIGFASYGSAIAPFWDEVVTTEEEVEDGESAVFYKTIGEEPDRMFVVQWSNVYPCSCSGEEAGTFELILYEGNNDIKFQYLDVDFDSLTNDNGGGATVGIERDGSTYLPYSFDDSILYSELAIVFTTESAEDQPHTGGPDEFGYTYIDSMAEGGPGFDFIDIGGTGTEILANEDLESQNVTIGFDFDFYGQTYNYVNVTTKGVLAFDGYEDSFDNAPIGEADTQNFIAPFWDDLITYDYLTEEELPEEYVGAGEIYNDTLGTAPNRMFIVQWTQVQHFENSTNGVTFEVILFENTSNILFQYGDVRFGTVDNADVVNNPDDGPDGTDFADNGGAATVAIVGPGGEFLQYSSNDPVLENELAILFSAEDTTPPAALTLIAPPDGAVTADDTPGLDWITPEEDVYYNVLVDNNSDFSSPEFEGEELDWTIFPHPIPSLSDGVYYWKARAIDTSDNAGPFSSVYTFTIDTEGLLSVEPATDLGPIDIALEEGELESIEAIAESDLPDDETKPEEWAFPFGFFSWTVTGLEPGETITMTLTYPTAVAAGSSYWKVIDGEWVDASEVLGSNDGDEIITLTVTDGGEFDVDGEENGEISDPGGVGEEMGSITIRKVELNSEPEILLPNSTFTITPNPFTLSGSLEVADNGDDDSDPADGIIEIQDVIFSTYTLEETATPEGYERITTSTTVSVHSGNPSPVVTVENRVEGEDIEETVEAPPPQLDEEEIEEFEDNGAEVNGEPVDSADDLPPALIAPPEDAGELNPDDVIFAEEADPDATGSDLFTDFSIPTYPAPDESIASEVVYAPPAFVIPGAEGSNFVLTPIIEEIFEEMTLLFFPPEETEVTSASIQSVEVEFGEQGSDVGFSFELLADIPEDLPDLDDIEEAALFLDVDFVGDIDFSDPDAFASPPEFVILVSKSLDGEDLPDGCPDIRLYLLNDVTDEWEVIETPERNPADDTASECSYIIHTEHFSKFAIGSVKGSISNVNSPGAGIGNSGRTVLVPQTFSNEYFEINPLSQVSVAETTFLTVNGQPSTEFSVGETVQISSTIYNHKPESQHYVFIVQILDEDGITQSISWSSGLLDKAQEYTTSHSWTTKEAGYYEVRIYIWTEWEVPAPLSSVEVSNLQVSWTGPIDSV